MGALARYLLKRLPGWLASLPKERLKELALELSKRFGVGVPDTVAGIIASVKQWLKENPLKAAVIADVAITFGMEGIDAILADIAGSADEDSQTRRVTEQLRKRLKEQRARVTGDGSLSTAHGETIAARPEGDESLEDPLTQEERALINANIAIAVSVLGSVEILAILRSVMFYEDDDFKRYQRSEERDFVFKTPAEQLKEARDFDALLDELRPNSKS